MSERMFPPQRAQELEKPAAWIEAHRRYYVNLVRHPESGEFLVLNTSMDIETPALRLPAKGFLRKLTVLDPAKVKSADQWLSEYKKLYANLIYRPSDRKMLVLSPTTLDVRAPVAEFQSAHSGPDALVAVSSVDEEVRARASEHLKHLQTNRDVAAQELYTEFRAKEQELLEAVTEWRNADTETRVLQGLTQRVGRLQVELAHMDDQRRQARYPYRYISNMSIPRLMTAPETRDESIQEIFRTVHMVATPADRIIEEGTA